jgi:hypothetical protein
MLDLFDIGMTVRLDRTIDRSKPCCSNIARIHPGKAQHAAELRCAECNSHRGWLRVEALTFLKSLTQHWSAPTEPLILRDTTIGDHQMTTERKYDNSGILFKNEDKTNERDRDYQGSLTVNGTEFWLSAWVKQGQRGKFMSLALKPKEESLGTSKKATQAKPDYDDQIPF